MRISKANLCDLLDSETSGYGPKRDNRNIMLNMFTYDRVMEQLEIVQQQTLINMPLVNGRSLWGWPLQDNAV